MRYRSQVSKRTGAVAVECAIIFPLLFLLTLGLIVGGTGVFMYNEVAHLSHETARYASTHGAQYQTDTGTQVALADLQNYAKQRCILIDPNSVKVNVQVTSGAGTAQWATPNNCSVITNGGSSGSEAQNVVTVTVQYPWQPMAVFGNWTSQFNLQSTATLPMNY